jgi:Protein of unknown function (DUF3349)
MSLGDRLSTIVAFLRAGYPTYMPATGYIPLLALLPRRVSDDEISATAGELIVRECWPIDGADIGVEITRITHEMPSLDDVARVQQRLAAIEWPDGHPDKPPGGA